MTGHLPPHVGVFGGGRMGAGIAHAFLAAGSAVTVIELGRAAVDASHIRIVESLSVAKERGKLSEGLDEVIGRLHVVDDAGALSIADLVIEAVPENPNLKATVLRTVQAVAPDAVLASNTSSLSIDELARHIDRPDQFVGLHFFNPVPTSDLVEIVAGSNTADDLVIQARMWVEALGKAAITVSDSPGFASSRLGVALALEAMRMLQEGVATAADIDTAMTLGYRHPTGPLRTTDIVGLDVRLAIAEHLARELGPRFEPPEILREHVANGRLGRKSGEGFYPW